MRRKQINKIAKRTLSVITAMVLFSGSLPMAEISEKLDMFNTALVAHAVDDYSKNPTLYSAQNIIDYSKAYREYPQNHYKDNIIINRSDDVANTSFAGFLSLGTPEYPFAGTITFNATATHDINIDTAFFDYVYDYVTIDGGVDAGIEKYMTIRPLNDNADALLANHVLHDDGSVTDAVYGTEEGQKTSATWTIEIAGYDGSTHTHGSLIGEMGASAECTVNLINDYSVAVENNIGSGESTFTDTGAVCGVMQTGSKLTIASVTGSAATSVTSSSGNAGGLVGTMNSGSTLTISGSSSDYVSNTSAITATSGYAGGIVGYNNQATVSGGYAAIKNTITGSLGAGGLYGYFKPIMVASDENHPDILDYCEFDLDDFTIGSGTETNDRCKVSSPVGAGGFFGVLDNPSGTITLTGSNTHIIYAMGKDDGTIFGGIVGSYKANSLEDTLSITGASGSVLTVNTNKSGNLSYYGGIIGNINGAYFASISDVNVNASSTADEFFGGAVACADTGYVYVNNITLSASSYRGGAIVGHTSNGVVHIAGTTNLASATSDTGVNYGQIVGYRDSALVFADSSWNLTRGTAVEADDIGSWGEIVRFKASDFTIGSVLDKYYVPTDETPYHYATLLGATFDGSKIKLSSKSTFATAALNMQLNGGTDTDVLKFSDKTNCAYDTLKTKSITMTASIDLSHTGMTGLTRDNGSRVEYAGAEFDGVSTSNKLTLAIGEGYEGTDTTSSDSTGKGMIYRHRYNGLFGETSADFTVKNVTISGCVYTKDRAGETDFYVGTVAGNAAKSFNANGVTVDNSTFITYGTASDKDRLYVGGLVSKMSAPGTSTIGRATASGTLDSTFSAAISGSAAVGNVYIGGVCGYVAASGIVNVHDIKITNSVSNTSERDVQTIGGLFATVAGGTLDLNGVETNALTVKGKMSSDGSMGGLLGYNWDGVSATFDNFDVTSCTLNNDSSSGNQAALVYTGSGYWKFKDVAISGLTLTGSSASSLGMLVNKAYSANKAMYLELPSGFTYTITGVTGTAPSIYDEIAVYTIMPDNTIEANGNSVISINTSGTTRYGVQSDSVVNMTSGSCNTYQNQVTGFNKVNPNSRYYYNVDTNKTASSGAAALYLWSVYQYAHSTIKSNIATTAPASTFTGTLSLDGYSYYPVDVSGTVDIQGSVTLCNKAIEDIEAASSGGNDSFARTTLNSTNQTQHYLMHAGLFRNVSGKININGSLSISGTVPDTGTYCGALICGTIGGSATADATVTSNNTGANISLSGIKVHNKDAEYSPLLINNASTNVVLDIYHVTASGYSAGDEIATSLIGVVGSNTAEKVRVTFSDIKLDARETASTPSDLTSVYGTTKCLFTRATLLESLTYSSGSGSSGIYNYEYDEDWDASHNHIGNVTYGKEISESTSKNYKKEFWYNNENHSSSTAHYTDPLNYDHTGNDDTNAPVSFAAYRPYVAIWGASIGSSSTMHQLDVNHVSATFGGCGTYNDPYTITDGMQFESIAKILSGTDSNGTFWLNYPDDTDKWCDNKTQHKAYRYYGSTFQTKEGTSVTPPDGGRYYQVMPFVEGDTTVYYVTDATKDTTVAPDDIRAHLAGAYYYLEKNITISENGNYPGLGSNSNDAYVFHGVIAGNDKTITNQSVSPLIYASNGCVIRNLEVIATKESIDLTSGTTSGEFSTSGGCDAYGSVIGRVFGGDNILDKVKVDVSGVTVTPSTLTPVGGYIGVIVNGGVFFRNMDDDHVPAANKAGFGTSGNYAATDTAHLYCNPIIGRVINGFAVNESDAYRPYEDGTRSYGDGSKEYWQSDGTVVTKTKAALDADTTLDDTMKVSAVGVTVKNGNKNYSITDIDSTLSDLSVSGTAITVPNSQAFFVMSLIVNSGMGIGTNTDSIMGYYGTNHITRHADYTYVGTNIKVSDYKTEENTNEEAEAAFMATDEYGDYSDTSADTNVTPYLIAEYSNNDAAVKTLGTSVFTLSLSDKIILPDGYKGIGNFYQNDDNFRLAISTFDGNGKTISQNTTNYSYDPNTLDNYSPEYAATYKDSNKEQYYSSASGLGLFNCQTQFGDYKNFTLTGNVKSLVYLSGGEFIQYLASNLSVTDKTRAQSVGGLFGTVSYKTTTGDTVNIANVKLDNIDIQSAKYAGGLIGFIPLNEKFDASWDNKTINITNNSSSQKIKVTGGLNAGGLIGFFYMGNINIDYNNNHFDITKIESLCLKQFGDTVASGAQYDLGCGGLLGVMRCNSTGNTLNGINCNTARVSNIIIGKTDTTYNGVVEATKYAGSDDPIYVGGVFGVLNRSPLIADNITVNNISVKGDSCTGGIVGWAGTNSQPTITNTTLFSNNGSEIGMTRYNKGQTGGFLGFNKNDTQTFTLISCKISGYTIQHRQTAGGVLGKWSANYPFDVKNFEISNCTIKANDQVGGIAGTLDSGKTLSGHNIYEKNIKICKYNNDLQLPTNYGCVIGSNNGIIKIVGFSRQDDQETSTMVNKVTGSGSYGTGGYIVFADYEGICDSTSKNTTFSPINNSNNVSSTLIVETIDKKEIKTQDSSRKAISFETKISTGSDSLTAGKTITKIVVTHDRNTVYTIIETVYNDSGDIISGPTTTTSTSNDYGLANTSEGRTKTIITTRNVIKVSNSPYVTMNPSITIDNIDGETGLLTSDGISKTAVTNILTDIKTGTSNKRYQNTGVTLTDYLWSSDNNEINSDIVSSFSAEFGDVITRKTYDFPLLVVNNTSTADRVINDYLKVLTNTSLDFSNDVAGQTYGSVGGSTDIATVTIQKCTYNNNAYTLSATDPCLKISSGAFVINTDSNGKEMYDTSVATGQFTLIDVAFKDPENTNEVAYHLYVPVMVKKLLEYNFDISAVSGSTYDQTLYTGNRGNNVVENLGAPVTMEFEYNYLRSATEWAAESDNAYGLDKYLSFDPQTVELFDNTTTKLVLVDINRGGKEYYLSKWSDGYNTTTKLLNLQAFKDAGGTAFAPVTFANMLSEQKISGDQTLKEKYYLTIFTAPFVRPKLLDENDEPILDENGKEQIDTELVKVIHYSVTTHNIGTTEHPTRRVDCADQPSGSYHYATHLVIGDFYTNTISVATPANATQRMSNNNKTVTVNISASIDLVNSGTRRLLRDYLGKSNVTIYQSLLASFEKYNNSSLYDKGLTAIDGYSIGSYTLTGQSGNIPITDRQILRTANFIEFQNNTDISDSLQNGSVTSTVQATLEFNSENTRKAQFPYKIGGQNTGALVIGYSNISSNKTNTAYSVVSVSDDDINSNMYYVESEETAELQYYADYSNANKQNQLNEQLGINAREIESSQTKSFIQTEGRYDTTGLLNASKAQYLECSLKLYQKQENGSYSEVSIDSYLDTLSVISGKTPVYANPTTHTYIFDIDDVEQFENEQYVYKIPITFNALTGSQTNFKDTYLYANYKVELTVSLFDHDGSTDSVAWSDHMGNSTISDWVIYTNARIYTDIINAPVS